MNKSVRYITSLALTALGLLSVFLTSSVIFDLFGIREMEGNYVLFIVYANFISGFIYIVSAYGLSTKKTWTVKLLALSSIILIVAFVGLNFHINNGGIYETKTFNAMIFRTSITILFTIIAYFTITKTIK